MEYEKISTILNIKCWWSIQVDFAER